MKKMTTLKQCIMAMAVVLNVVFAFLALAFQLPIYLDSIGTVFIGSLLGPVYGAVTGMLSGAIIGVTFDVYALYYIPAQILTGCAAGLIYRTRCMGKKSFPLGVFAISVPTSIASAIVTAFVFAGITSSNSTYLVMVMNKFGVSMMISCFVVQVITDYFDELVSSVVTNMLLKALPSDMKTRIRGGSHQTHC